MDGMSNIIVEICLQLRTYRYVLGLVCARRKVSLSHHQPNIYKQKSSVQGKYHCTRTIQQAPC